VRNLRIQRSSVLLVAMAVLLALVVPMTGTAVASHTRTNTTLEVEPETATRGVGTTHTLTATITPSGDATTRTDQVFIDAELQSGSANDQDGTTYGTPDLGCTIPGSSAGQTAPTSCTITYTGNRTGTDTIRVWIDYDGSNATIEADQNEDREEREDPTPETPNDPSDDNLGARGTGCPSSPPSPSDPAPTEQPGGLNQAAEPDCTDVVSVTWTGAASTPTTLDCDDSGPPDTEREANQSTTSGTSANAQSDEVYRCTVRDQSGTQLTGIEVKGEVQNGINDPDEPDGDSKERPDYNCRTASAPVSEAPLGGVAYCEVTVRQYESEQGLADICFWVGDAPTGDALCGNEDVGEDQTPQAPFGGDGTGNDLADRVWKAWHQNELDCEPETDTNPTGTQHEITCTVQSVGRDPNTGQPTRRGGNINIDVEASGANDPQADGDTATSRRNPDFSCTTRADDPTTPQTNEGGICVIRHGPGGTGSTANTGITLYRAWIDIDNNDSTDEADPAEGRDENTTPGSELERDDTDVVEKRWTAPPTSMTVSPKTDSAAVGTCNAYTVTVSAGQNTPGEGATIDVEQRHERAQNSTTNDEPRVFFCRPTEGPNPSDVDETRGDLRPPEENPDNQGTAGGETTTPTDSQGRVTIGIGVAPANGSNGTGRVDLIFFFESTDNDDPDSGEPQDTASKTWTPGSGAGAARRIDCEPETASNPIRTNHVVTCTVTDSQNRVVQGESVTFTETGPGTVSPTTATTDANGRATTTATSTETGTQTITGTLTSDTTGSEPSEVDECDRPANDPQQGAVAGECSDSVTKTWTEAEPQCSDGVDNDGDEWTDYPNDPGCESEQDDDEFNEPLVPSGPCGGRTQNTSTPIPGGSGNIIVGTDGNDVLTGTDGNDIICGLGGDDIITALGGKDQVVGNAGNDSISGRDGNDALDGGGGDDTIKGNKGVDTLRGRGGNDALQGGDGEDTAIGGGGNDVMRGWDQNDTLRGGAGRDTADGGKGRRDVCDAERQRACER
jgi:Ca2+-binding RTX toxin-like protein